MKSLKLIKLSLCGPSDVAKEVTIAIKVIEDWNRLHSESRGLTIKHQHWKTDSYPDATKSGQDAISHQMIDESHIIVAVFWSRLGTPTAAAVSGTAEEIKRGIDQKRKVLVYFSNREPLPPNADQKQIDLLWDFRQELRAKSSYWSFNSHSQFREEFTGHLALALNSFEAAVPKPRKPKAPSVTQTIKGSKNVQINGDGNSIQNFQNPAVVKNVIARNPDWVSPKEERRISKWIEKLAEGTLGKARDAAFAEWGSRFLNKFDLSNRGQLPSSSMPEAKKWYQDQRTIQKRGYRNKAPGAWKSERITAIKSAMSDMKKENATYYPELTHRLGLKKPLKSLTLLTRIDLERVYSMVFRDKQNN